MVIKQKLNFWIVSYSILIIETTVPTLYLKKRDAKKTEGNEFQAMVFSTTNKGKGSGAHRDPDTLTFTYHCPTTAVLMWPYQLSVRISKQGYQMIYKIVLIISQNYWVIILWIGTKTSCDLSKDHVFYICSYCTHNEIHYDCSFWVSEIQFPYL